MLRDHYGPNWLQAMGPHFNSDTGRSDASNSAASDSDTTSKVVNNTTSKTSSNISSKISSNISSKDTGKETKTSATTSPQSAVMRNGLSESVPTADDLYLNEPVRSLSLSRSTEEEWTEMKKQNGHGGNLSQVSDFSNSKKVPAVRQESSGFEWTRSEDEEIESYGNVFHIIASFI